MRQVYTAAFALLIMLLPAQAWAKGDNVKITIKCRGFIEPFVITEKSSLGRFLIWTGPGTGPIAPAPQSFIVNWAKGFVAAPEEGLEVCAVEFLTTRTDKNTYRVSYVYDALKQQGYVYLPGKTDPSYEENVWLIYRGVEGNWFYAWGEWDAVIRRLLLNQR